MAMGPAGERFKALQIHPTRFCNLTCLHCYSSSGPEQREALGAPLLVDAITEAGAEGYNDIAFSGGEPILYGDLRRLLINLDIYVALMQSDGRGQSACFPAAMERSVRCDGLPGQAHRRHLPDNARLFL